MSWQNIKNGIIANGEFYKTNGLQEVCCNLHGELPILDYRRFHKDIFVLFPFLKLGALFLLHVSVFCVLIYISYRILSLFVIFLFYVLISILSLFFLIMVYCFCDTFFFHHKDILGFVGIALFDILPNILYNKSLVIFGVLFCILDKFSYENDSINLLFVQGDI